MSEPAGGSPAVADVPASGPDGGDRPVRTQVRPRRLRRSGLAGCAALLLGASALMSAGTAVPSPAKLPGSAFVQAELVLEAQPLLDQVAQDNVPQDNVPQDKVPREHLGPLLLVAQSTAVVKAGHRNPFNESAVCASYPVAPGSYRISSPYGYRVHPIFGNYSMHMGDDYAAPLGTPIHAVTDGTVVYTGPGRLGRSSELVIIEHTVEDTTFYSWYVHMYPEGIFVEVGQRVLAGEVIAEVGNNGNSTGPHLHFEIHTSDPGVGLQKTPVGRSSAAHVVGVFPDTPDGEDSEDPDGEESENPDGEDSQDPDGEESEDPDGEDSEDPDGEKTEDPDGEKSQDPDGEDSEDPDGEKSQDPDGEKSQDPADEDSEDKPGEQPSDEPTDEEPTDESSEKPSDKPSEQPTEDPSEEPTNEETDEPAEEPTDEETEESSPEPTAEATEDDEGEEDQRRTRTPFPTHAYGTTVDPTTFLASLGLTMAAPNQCLVP